MTRSTEHPIATTIHQQQPAEKVATLVCNPATPVLTRALADHACTLLPDTASVNWLAPDIAVDIAFASPGASDKWRDVLRMELAGTPVDIAVQPAEGRRKHLFIADMDSTIIAQECIDELADLVGLRARVSAITERAMRGEIAFEPALRERVSLLAGLKASVVADVIASRITLTPGARTLVQTMRANGTYTALISGGFTAFTGVIAAMVGFDENRANTLIIENDVFAGRVSDPIVNSSVKRTALMQLRAQKNLSPQDTLAVGDGANDLEMLGEAGLGIAYHAKPAVAAAAHVRVDHSDLTALLYMQGYARSEFID